MDIREFLAEVGATYDRNLGTKRNVYAQDLLRAASHHFAPYVPVGWEVSGHGGQTSAAFTPWVGIFSPTVTLKPHEGLYLVYLFAADLRTVTLALNQGVTNLRAELGQAGAVTELEKEVARLVSALPPSLLAGWTEPMDLACPRPTQRAYEAGAVATRRYALNDLPPEDELRADLWRMAELLDLAALNQAERLRTVKSDQEDSDFSAATRIATTAGDPAERFKPKDARDYVAHTVGRRLVKRREHEALIDQFGRHAINQGFSPNTNVHPRDLTLKKDGVHWLVEAKAIYSGNATQAVREATGQLLTYRHFLYTSQGEANPHLLGLFTESVGDGYVEFLETVGIGSVWRTPSGWNGSGLARGWGLV